MNKVSGKVIRATAGAVSLALAMTGVLILFVHQHNAAPQAAERSTNSVTAHSAAVGALDPRARTCAGQGPAIGEVGLLRAGKTGPARAALGSSLTTQVRDSVSGNLMFFRPAAGMGPAQFGSYFTRVATVHAQSAIPALHTCDMLLSNRPAARPIVTAALRAAVADHLAASVSKLRASVQVILVSNNPLRSGSVIVTLLLPGPARAPLSKGAPVTHKLEPVTVIMSYPGAKVSGLSRGGL